MGNSSDRNFDETDGDKNSVHPTLDFYVQIMKINAKAFNFVVKKLFKWMSLLWFDWHLRSFQWCHYQWQFEKQK